ncbi:MAG: hypothetical protein U0X73_00285 [Thermoanaerobaculia bacterium]
MNATSEVEGRLRRLAAAREGWHVSIGLPIEAEADAAHRFQVHLSNAVRRADHLLADAGARETERDRLLRPIVQRFGPEAPRPPRAAGLAIFSAPETLETVATAFPLAERVEVGGHFMLRPLLPCLARATEFRVLAVSRNALRLLVATADTVRRIELPAIDADEGPATAERARELEARSAVTIGGSSSPRVKLVHAAAPTGGEAERVDLDRYARRVAAAVTPHLAGSDAPIVLAAPERYLPLLRLALGDLPVVAGGVPGSHDRSSDEELRDAAWQRVVAWRAERRARLLERFESLEGERLALREVDEVLFAAERGRVAVLLAAEDRPVAHAGAASELATEDEKVERAIAAVLGHGGSIEPLPRDDMPGRGALAALLRW